VKSVSQQNVVFRTVAAGSDGCCRL
jgi:hypothetical protein